MQEFIEIAADIRKAEERGEVSGLKEDEIMFYDALAENFRIGDGERWS